MTMGRDCVQDKGVTALGPRSTLILEADTVIRAAVVLLVCLSLNVVTGFAQSSAIGAATIDSLDLGYAVPLPGDCGAFSRDDRLLDSLDLASGQVYFKVNHYVHDSAPDANVTILRPDFVAQLAPESQIDADRLSVRPDRNLLLIQRLGAFDLRTGLRQVDFLGFAGLSPDGALLAVPNTGLYDVRDWTLKLPLSVNTKVEFSPDSRLFAVSGDGVFSAETGKRRFRISGSVPVFSPDGRWLAVERDGLYAIESGERSIEFGSAPFAAPRFSPDSHWLAAGGAVYDLTSGEKRFDMTIRNAATFSPDSRRVVGADGVYELESGQRLFELNGAAASWSSDSSLVASVDGQVVDAATGSPLMAAIGQPTFSPGGAWLSVDYMPYCLIYGLSSATYPYRSGLVDPNSGVNIRRRPTLLSDVLHSTGDFLAVSARTPDNRWFKVFYREFTGWVSADAVRVVEMPDAVPVEPY